MKKFFNAIDTYLLYKSPLSKTGLVFLGLSFLLTLISFSKGIQVLMFVPAFILALFFFSAWDYWTAFRKISLIKNKKERTCTLFIPKGLDGYFFRVAIKKNGEWSFLSIDTSHVSWKIPEGVTDISLLSSGRLDIFQRVQPLPLEIKNFSYDAVSLESDNILLEIEEYEQGDNLAHIDSKKTALTDRIFIRKRISFREKEQKMQHQGNILEISSDQEILPFATSRYLSRGFLAEWLLIGIGFIGVFLEWGGILFPLLFLLSYSLVFYFFSVQKKPPFPKKYLNGVALLLFFGSLAEGILTLNTVLSGAHFLLLLSVWKHAFPRERRDAFTYIFLILFVFIALSLYSLSAWFLLLFLLFLLVSGFIFTVFSGGEVKEEYSGRFGTPYSKSFFVRYAIALFCSLFILFLILPHGEAAKNTTSLISTQTEAQTGFTDTVDLHSVGSIKQNFSKKIVIENADPEKIDFYSSLYWRGARFQFFDGNTWEKVPEEKRPFRSIFSSDRATEKVDIKIYADGGKNVFFPFSPIAIKLTGTRVFSTTPDRTIFETSQASPTAIFLQTTFFLDARKNWESAPEYGVNQPQHCADDTCVFSPEIEAVFAPFWEKIPEDVTHNPQALSDYIQNTFSYSLSDPARDMQDFLYGSQQGHCEYFASVLVITLQHFGHTTATLVNGFHGGDWNNQALAWVVRNQNAHSWAEIYIPEKKYWMYLDPTPSSAGGADKRWYQENMLSAFFIDVYDAIELRWNRFFVEFTGSKQKELFLWIFSFWPFILLAIVVLIAGKKGFRYYKFVYLPLQKMTPLEQFEYFLVNKVFQRNLLSVMTVLEKKYPDLVSETRAVLYGKEEKSEKIPQKIRELQSLWIQKKDEITQFLEIQNT